MPLNEVRMGVIGAGGAGRSRVRSMLNTYEDKLRIVATADPNEGNVVQLEKIAGKILAFLDNLAS